MSTKYIGNLVLAAGIAACQGSTPSEPTPEPTAPSAPDGTLVSGPERDLQVFTQHAINAFRKEGAAYLAGHLTHEARVANGIVEVTPYHYNENHDRTKGGAITVRTSTVHVGATAFDSDGTTRLVDGVLEMPRSGVVETITNREDGLEQAWRFDVAPPSTGDLVVTVAVAGQKLVADTATGLHFQSDKGLGFRYSDAVWVEANGNRWAVEARYENGAIVMTVPEDVVANTAFPAVLDPTITAEVAVDAPVNGGSGASALNAAIASDGTNYLVVWTDRRLSTDGDIFGTRLSSTGTILDATGIAIDTGSGPQSRPAVAFAGGTFVVVWEDFKVSGGTEADIGAARVSTGGVVTPLGRIASTGLSETEPAIGGGGGTALATWTAGGGDILGAIFNGTTFGPPAAIAITTTEEKQSAVAGIPGGSYLVAWSEGALNEDLRGQLVTQAGVLSGAAIDISVGAGRQFDPSAAFDGTNYALAWAVNSNGLNIFGARVSPAGVVLDTHAEGTVTVGGVVISQAAGSQEQPAIACNATCMVLWRDQRNISTTSNDIFGQPLNADFTPAGGEISVSVIPQPQQAPAVAADGTGFFGAWHDLRDAQLTTVFGSTISAAGAVGTANLLVTGNNREQNPAVGRAGGTQMVAWTDSRTGSADIEFVRFNGLNKLDATARVVSSETFAQFAPAISSSTGTQAYVVWSDTRGGANADIFGTKVNNDGTVTAANGIAINQSAGDQLVPQVSANANGTTALVVWQDRRNNNFDIIGAVLDANGNVVANDIVICNAAGDQTRPYAAFDTTNQQWIVVWSDGRDNTDFDIFAARVTVAGGVLDPNGVEISGPSAGSQFAPVIAFTSNVFLAVWQDRRNDGEGDIMGTRLRAGASLSILDPNSITYGNTTAGQSAPTVAQNVGAFVVAWQDTRNLLTTGSDIFGIGVSSSGTVSEPEFVVSAQPGDETTPIMGDSSATKVSRIAYTKVNASLATTRVATRQITIGAGTGNACTTDAQCGIAGFCRDGKCCDSDCGGAGNTTDCLACKATLTGQPDGVCGTTLAGKLCRGYADTFCDREEKCNGVDTTCPEDIGRREGVACTIAGGGTGTCPANDVTGAPHVCQ
jgi:large repetitive protein